MPTVITVRAISFSFPLQFYPLHSVKPSLLAYMISNAFMLVAKFRLNNNIAVVIFTGWLSSLGVHPFFGFQELNI